MKIGLHGGNCCGIKHIYRLGHPNVKLSARKAIKRTSFGQSFSGALNDMFQINRYRKYDFFNEAAPKETGEERFARFVDFIKTNRKHGIIEVVINTSLNVWLPILEKHGFQKVSQGKNSNTGSTISVYHLVY